MTAMNPNGDLDTSYLRQGDVDRLCPLDARGVGE